MKFFLTLLAATTFSCVCMAQGVKKCVDADGNVTFQQGDCPKTNEQEDIKIHQENRNPHGALQFPETTDGLEWVWVASVLDNNDGGVIVRESGDSYVIQKLNGCAALWRYENSFVQVFSPREFAEDQGQLVLPDHQQRCTLLSIKRNQGTVDLSGIPSSPTPTPAPAPAPAIAVAQPGRVPQQQNLNRPEVDPEDCRAMRRQHRELNKRCRGLEECDTKRFAIKDLQRQWASSRCDGALGIGPD